MVAHLPYVDCVFRHLSRASLLTGGEASVFSDRVTSPLPSALPQLTCWHCPFTHPFPATLVSWMISQTHQSGLCYRVSACAFRVTWDTLFLSSIRPLLKCHLLVILPAGESSPFCPAPPSGSTALFFSHACRDLTYLSVCLSVSPSRKQTPRRLGFIYRVPHCTPSICQRLACSKRSIHAQNQRLHIRLIKAL